jgi:hypothetical protein
MVETPVLPVPQPSNRQSSLVAADGQEATSLQVAQALLAEGVRGDELERAVSTNDAWLWQGYLGPGSITLLTSQWKSGKTTLIAVLLAKMAHGGELAGLPVKPGRAAIVSEEGLENWKARCKRLQIGRHLTFFCRPFKAKPTPVEWQGLVEAMLMLKRRDGRWVAAPGIFSIRRTSGLRLPCLCSPG